MFTILVAHDNTYGIGRCNQLPWDIREDLMFFKRTTMHSIVIVGRVTYDSMPALPGRIVYVITSRNIPDVHTFKSLDDALDHAKQSNKKIYVIGGESIYNLCKGHTYDILSTCIHAKYDCDRYINKHLFIDKTPRVIERKKVLDRLTNQLVVISITLYS